MKNVKKLASLLLALVMVFALATTAFAAGNDGSITISNATKGETYAIYKVFDLTYSGENVAYSYTKTGEVDSLYNALADSESPFTLTKTSIANTYNVSLKSSKTAADVSQYLTDNMNLLTKTAEKEADSNTVVFYNLSYGYYYITSSLGAVVSLDSTMKDVTVIDKNQKPGWDPENPEKPDQSGGQGKFVADSADSEYGKTSTAAIGDTVYFKINAFAPKYAGDKLVSAYTFTDTLSDGFTYTNNLKVTMNDSVLAQGTAYTVNVVGQKITVVVNAGTITDYPVEAHLSITYTAQVDADAVYDNTNTVKMDWTVYPNDGNGDPNTEETPYNPNDPDDPNYPGKDPIAPGNPEDSKTDTYVFGFNIQKYKDEVKENNKLTGAKFRLYDAETGGNEIKVVKVTDGVYRVATPEEAAAEGFVSAEIEAGAATIFGLDANTYYLEETSAPNGYNILTVRQPITISQEKDADANGYLDDTIGIINKAGALLPTTGGMGTTLFYVLGGLLATGAVVLLVVKKRMSRAER